MSALHESGSSLDRQAAALFDLLREELAPYPGRAAVVARMVFSSVAVMLLVMTFHVPGAALAGYYTLLLSRESPRATLAGAVELVASFGAGVAYVLLSALIFFGSPVLHFLWVILSLFVIFLGMRALRSYSAAAGFGFLIATCIPLWDRAQPSELSVEATLWTAGSVALGAAVTVAVEYVSSPFRKHESWEQALLERWRAVRLVLSGVATGTPDPQAAFRLTQFAAVGVSRSRRNLLRSGRSMEYIERTGTILSITQQLVDLAASLLHLHQRATYPRDERLLQVSSALQAIEIELREPANRAQAGRETSPEIQHAQATSAPPLLPEIERTVSLLRSAMSGRGETDTTAGQDATATRQSIFVSDAWRNADHVRFALKGCLAASLCYIFFNAIGWPGLNTSVATCIVTALSSIGSSRQKQILRISGALVGGVLFGMGAQVFLLPGIDSITGFMLLFATVTGLAAWISTASARLSYFGLQIALAFFLINLQEFSFQTSLTIARDRVFGILLGLFVMWVVFDLPGGVRAADQMCARFRQSLLRLAELQELSFAPDPDAIVTRTSALREDLIGIFASINTEADAVLLETGPRRSADLQLRERILSLQPALRSILLLQVTMLQYRRRRLIRDLPPPLAAAQRDFDQSVAAFLRALAKSFPRWPEEPAIESPDELRHAVYGYYRQSGVETISPSAHAVLSLADSLAWTLAGMRPLDPNGSQSATGDQTIANPCTA